MKTVIAAVIGAAAMGLVSAGAYAATQRSDPSMVKLQRNSYIAAALAIVAGIYVGKKKNPMWGVAIATGGAALLIATKVAVFVGGLVSKPTTPAMAAVYGNMGAYARMNGYTAQMSGYARQMGMGAARQGAVYGNMGRVGAVYGNMGRLGQASRDFVPQPNWRGNPF